MSNQRLRCAVCQDVIGVYEPVVVLDGSSLRHTSVLNEPLDAEQVVMHRHCASEADAGPARAPDRLS